MIKPIQSNIKSTSAAALSERSVSFETWRHFVIELFKLNRLIYPNVLGKYIQKRRRACNRVYGKHCRLIFSIPPSFKPVPLSSSCISSILKHPKQVFFLTLSTYLSLLPQLYTLLLILLFFHFNVKFFFNFTSPSHVAHVVLLFNRSNIKLQNY